MARLKQGTLVVVADSEKALFLRNLTDHENPNLDFEGSKEQDNPSDRDWHELAKERFAADLSDKLYAMAHKGEFDRLVIVASPQVLGVLRDDMHKEVTDKIIAEVPKTLTNHPVNKIEDLVKKELDAA